jgi:hypothetical protein
MFVSDPRSLCTQRQWGRVVKVFISYRRDDSQIASQSIYEALVHEIGKDQVFFDVDDIPYGVNFKSHLDRVVAECGIMLVMIGPEWLRLVDTQGRRRLDDPTDFVRVEVEAGLKRGITVIPVLLKGAEMPAANQLPTAIAELSFLNAAIVEWGADLRAHRERLFRVIHRLRATPTASSTSPQKAGSREDAADVLGSSDRWSPGRARWGFIGGALLVAAIAWFVGTNTPDSAWFSADSSGSRSVVAVPKAEHALNPKTLNILGEQAYKAKHYGLAIARYSLAIQKKPDYTRAYGNLILALNRQKRFDEVISVGKKGIATASDRTQDLHVAALNYQIGKAHEGKGQDQLAVKRYRLAETAAMNAGENTPGAKKYLEVYRLALNRLAAPTTPATPPQAAPATAPAKAPASAAPEVRPASKEEVVNP